MNYTISGAEMPVIKTFVHNQVKFPDRFNSTIDNQDEMYLFALQNQGSPERAIIRYYSNGIRIFDAVKQVVDWHFGSFHKIGAFLDFASGYGRSTRFFVQEIPSDKVWISDIYAEGVKFQVEQFGVNGIVSTSQPKDYLCSQSFDVILACSFFSHLPKATFSQWLKVLYNLLNPNGLLLFSVHDRSLLPSHLMIDDSELLFCLNSESRTLDLGEYGTSYVGENFVANTMADISEHQAVYHRIPQGICRYQDLYILAKNPTMTWENFRYYHHPIGKIEHCHLTADGVLELGGWVSEINPGGQVSEILVYLNTLLVYRQTITCSDNYDHQWHFSLKLDQVNLDDIILVKTINNFGLEWVFDCAPLEFWLRGN